ncbi:alpha/beta hydrolase [Amnibacterium sp. CER49]|uniref:alpha/beta fold hydrolase n=1 Tax=Amnibacterium sp. CER49 TaxID=3039161 RepID=UPI002446B285|nr:alpha/beta hydrolase [Amnibacterium sp. CER49]MDH2444564.1 alpha/beta hydrolase [Amnibacterium sp. CER49]
MAGTLEPTRVPTALGELAVHALGAGRPTVLWHALFTDGSSWGYVLPSLLKGRRLLVVDGPGAGRSARLRRRVPFASAVGAAGELLEALAPRETVDWVGDGWGGAVGIALAADRPELVRSLVAIAAPLEPPAGEERRRLRRLLRRLFLLGPIPPVGPALLDRLVAPEARSDPSSVGVVLDAVLLAGRVSAARAGSSFLLGQPDLTALLPRIDAPTLLVAGGDDPSWGSADVDRAAALAPFARSAVVPRSRVLVPVEQPAALSTLIQGFWASLETPD